MDQESINFPFRCKRSVLKISKNRAASRTLPFLVSKNACLCCSQTGFRKTFRYRAMQSHGQVLRQGIGQNFWLYLQQGSRQPFGKAFGAKLLANLWALFFAGEIQIDEKIHQIKNQFHQTKKFIQKPLSKKTISSKTALIRNAFIKTILIRNHFHHKSHTDKPLTTPWKGQMNLTLLTTRRKLYLTQPTAHKGLTSKRALRE